MKKLLEKFTTIPRVIFAFLIIAVLLFVITSPLILLAHIIDKKNQEKEAKRQKFINYICKNIEKENDEKSDFACWSLLHDTILDVDYYNLFDTNIAVGLRNDVKDIMESRTGNENVNQDESEDQIKNERQPIKYKSDNSRIDKDACLKSGGKWSTWLNREFCNLPTSDAGKECTDGGECDGECLAEKKESDIFTLTDAKGKCSGWTIVLGCYSRIVKGAT